MGLLDNARANIKYIKKHGGFRSKRQALAMITSASAMLAGFYFNLLIVCGNITIWNIDYTKIMGLLGLSMTLTGAMWLGSELNSERDLIMKLRELGRPDRKHKKGV